METNCKLCGVISLNIFQDHSFTKNSQTFLDRTGFDNSEYFSDTIIILLSFFILTNNIGDSTTPEFNYFLLLFCYAKYKNKRCPRKKLVGVYNPTIKYINFGGFSLKVTCAHLFNLVETF